MLINSTTLSTLFTGFKAAFNQGETSAPSHWKAIALKQPSSTSEEQYGWMKQLPAMREWVGPRIVNNVALSGYTIVNKKFESTIGISREAIEDDQYGSIKPILAEMGKAAATHPDELVFALLRDGFTRNCYDSQFFFDTDHPVEINGATTIVSNMQAGAGASWYLLDTSRAIAVDLSGGMPYELQEMTKSSDESVFKSDEFLYGVRARGNAGYGLWQLAFGSKAALNGANYGAARQAMQEFKGKVKPRRDA